jgi:hypothetical protein
MPRKKPQSAGASAIAVLLRDFGIRKTMRILDISTSWAIALRANGWEPITAEQYGEYWRMGRASAFRDQRFWRECFPQSENPNATLIAVREQLEAKMADEGLTKPSRDDVASVLVTLPGFAA